MGDGIISGSQGSNPIHFRSPESPGSAEVNGKKRGFFDFLPQKSSSFDSKFDLRQKKIERENHTTISARLSKANKNDLLRLRDELGKENFAVSVASFIREYPATEESYEGLSLFLARLIQAFPELKDFIKANSIRVLLTKGVEYLVQSAHSITVHESCSVCDSREEFIEKLKTITKFPHAFLVQCSYMGGSSHHFTPFYVTKDTKGNFEILNSDSTTNALYVYPFKNIGEELKSSVTLICPSYPLKVGEKFAPFARQQDKINCALFALHDVHYWLKNPKIAEKVMRQAKSEGTQHGNYIGLPWYKFFPVRMMKTAQRFELISQFQKETKEKSKEDWEYLEKKLSKFEREVRAEKQNWYIELKARKNIAKVVQYVLP